MTLCAVFALTKPCTLMNLYVKFQTVNQCMLTMLLFYMMTVHCFITATLLYHSTQTIYLTFNSSNNNNNNNPPRSPTTVACVLYQLSSFFTARKRSLRRLCFHRCLSVHRGVYPSMHWAGGVCVSQHALGRGVSAQRGVSAWGPEVDTPGQTLPGQTPSP